MYPPMSVSIDERHPRREFSYRSKLLLAVCSLVLITGAAVTVFSFRSLRETTTWLAGNVFREVSAHAVTETRDFVMRAVPLVESLGELAGHGLAVDDSDQLARQLLAMLNANPGMSWISYGNENGTFTGAYRVPEGVIRINQSRIVDGKTALVEHEVQADSSWKVFRNDPDSGYDPRTRPFYLKAKQEKRLVWLPPYVFYDQGVPGITCADPLYDSAGKLRGVFTVDFDLNALADFTSRLSISPHSDLFLFTSDGLLLAHPNKRLISRIGQRGIGELPKLSDVQDPLVESFQRELANVPLREANEFHAFQFTRDRKDYIASATTFRMGDDLTWVVGALAPASDFLGGVRRSERIALIVSGAAVLLALVLAAMLARRVSGPVLDLIGFMGRVGKGELDARADFGGSREFRQLSNALNHMIDDLRDHIRLRDSIQIAKDVQQRLLPMRVPNIEGLDIAGHNTYCDETGGDYYDFLLPEGIGPGKVMLAVGDVVGHGVAAALVMAGVRAVVRDRVSHCGNFPELMSRLNGLLFGDLGGFGFMTMHISIVDAIAGTFCWASAGHDPALIYDPVCNCFAELKFGDIPLGVLDDAQYEQYIHEGLRPGQVIVIGTDGVWEARNEAGEVFGKERLREVIRNAASGSAAQVSAAILEKLTAFRWKARPSDDITFIVVKLLSRELDQPSSRPSRPK